MKKKLALLGLAIAVGCLSGCGGREGDNVISFTNGPNEDDKAEQVSMSPDRILYERGISALEDQKHDVACLTLQTLINTYPDSDYAITARSVIDHERCENGFEVQQDLMVFFNSASQ